MNDRCLSLPKELRPRRRTSMNTGSSMRPHHLTALNTVSAMALPLTVRSSVPVAAGPAAMVALVMGNLGRSGVRGQEGEPGGRSAVAAGAVVGLDELDLDPRHGG